MTLCLLSSPTIPAGGTEEEPPLGISDDDDGGDDDVAAHDQASHRNHLTALRSRLAEQRRALLEQEVSLQQQGGSTACGPDHLSQQQQEEGMVQGSGSGPLTADGHNAKICVVCQWGGGGRANREAKLRIAPDKTFRHLLQGLKQQLRSKGDVSLPAEGSEEDDQLFRLEFDSERVDLDSSLADVGMEDGDRIDVSWKL